MGPASATQPPAASSLPGHPPPAGKHAVGDLLDGRYRLVARIGQGGFGDVWRADELLPDGAPFRQVALKLLVAGAGDEVDWAEEAKLLASFRHPSLVTIYAAGILATSTADARDASGIALGATIAQPVSSEVPGSLSSSPETARVVSTRVAAQRYVAMELLEGQNLSDLAKAKGPLAWRRVLAWASSAAGALDLIHAAGVVHLDLKPANLFLCADGALKVLDFGIARRSGVEAVAARRGATLHRDATTLEAERATGLFIAARLEGTTARSHGEDAFAATRAMDPVHVGREAVIGTPGFMAPEILELERPTAAADAYALAVCVVQLCTGHLPHAAPDEPVAWDDPTEVSAWLDAIRTATLRGSMRPLDEGPRALPRGLASLVRRLLSVDPAARRVTPGSLRALFEEVWARPYGVSDPPYFARRPYPPEAEGFLFGRDDDIARFGRELEYEPCLILQGAKGVGKSSLLQAGIVPYLGKNAVDGKDDWSRVHASEGPDESIDAALASALRRVDPALEQASVEALAHHCARARVGLALVIDPLWDLSADGVGDARVRALVAEIAQGPVRVGLRLIVAASEDTTRSLLSSPLGPSVRAAVRFVGPPAMAAVTDIVTGPARHAGVTTTGADTIASDVRQELRASGTRLPFVAIALEEWWRGGGKAVPAKGPVSLRGSRWEETGGVGGAVVRHAERVFAALDGERRAVAEELLLRLSATDGAEVRWEEDELCSTVLTADPEPGASAATAGVPSLVREVLRELERELLVRRLSGASASVHLVEIGHEALVKDWPRLTSARLAHMDRLLLLERVREARLAWERSDNHKDFLLHGALLDDVRTRGSLLDRGLGAADRGFLRASLRRARFRRVGRAAAAALVVTALGAGLASKRMIDDAREDEARAKAAAIELEQLTELAAKARRTEDPYYRATLLAAGLARGSTDGLLALDLMTTAQNLVRADFLTLDHVESPAFPWDDRFLVASTSATTLDIFDFRPPEPDVIEDVELDFDPAEPDTAHFKRPALHRLRPHDTSIVERVDFAFDTAFATRAASGEVKVFRLRDDGAPALAAIAPIRCVGTMRVAAGAPVIACGTDQGTARWDMRRRAAPDAVTRNASPGDVADLSPDGERVAVVSGKDVLFWSPPLEADGGSEARYSAPRPVTLVRLAPRGHAAAVLEGVRVEIVDTRHPRSPSFALDPEETGAVDLRWDPGGVDLAVCDAKGGHWYYLRKGARAPGDAAPKADPCASARTFPAPVPSLDAAPELADRDVGPHVPSGGFRLRAHRYVTRDLVVLDPGFGHDILSPPGASSPAAARLLRFDARDDIGGEEAREPDDSVVAVERDDTGVMFQVGDEMRFYALPERTRMFVRKGTFLRRCDDGRFLAWEIEGSSYRVFDAWTGAAVRSVAREPGFVIGAGGACRALYTQRLDGTIVDNPLDGRPARDLGVADGYAYDAHPAGGRHGHRGGGGLLLAFSSGAVARIDDATHTLHVLGYATPFARAIAEGPEPGDAVVADASGIVLLRPSAAPISLGGAEGLVEWSDLAMSADGASLLLVAPGRVAALDVARHELLGSFPAPGRDRIARWDDEGSVLLWSFDRKGGADGVVVPRGPTLARRVAEAVANLEVAKGRVAIRP